MEIECITHQNLAAYLQSPRYLKSKHLPITRHRGLSHVYNPHAQADDLVLTNIYIGNELVAYRVILPDTLYIDHKKIHVGWLSCLWVNPSMRGKGIAKKILKPTLEYWDGNIFSTKPSPQAKSLYLKTGTFDVLELEDGIKAHRRLNLALFLPSKNKKWNWFSFPLKVVDSIFNTIFGWINMIDSKKLANPFFVQEIEKVDASIFSFIQEFQKDNLIQKGIEDFDWQLNFPWVKNSVEAKKDQSKYFFSSYAERFETRYFKFLDKENTIAFLVLTTRNDELKIPYVYYEQENDTISEAITAHIFDFMKEEKISTIATAHQKIIAWIEKKKHLFFLFRNIKREYLISKKLKGKLSNQKLTLQDGAGDAAFT